MTARNFDLRSTTLVVVGHGNSPDWSASWIASGAGLPDSPSVGASTRSAIYRRPRGGMFV